RAAARWQQKVGVCDRRIYHILASPERGCVRLHHVGGWLLLRAQSGWNFAVALADGRHHRLITSDRVRWNYLCLRERPIVGDQTERRKAMGLPRGRCDRMQPADFGRW